VPQRQLTSILEEIATHTTAHPEWLALSEGTVAYRTAAHALAENG
jgi:hypothetical protein